ncbi:hypothetical protein [Dyadobacter crusticola]|uniref:hypothetical protein n=1 Tax=Dyadobacter crusticola TaxID=292407 RepID=UPI0004E1EA83|nr:hypothetical protein [Dyadobacter crusticola]
MEKLSPLLPNKTRSFRPKSMICGTLLSASLATASFGQGVGINTTTPDPSAALDIQATDKGILIPRVSLQSLGDNTTVLTPANGLLVYNLNPEMPGGLGFFYNIGTPQSPHWESIRDLRLPVNASISTNSGGTAFRINDFSQSGSSTTIHAFSQAGYALFADGKVKISGNGQQPGSGKMLSSDGSGNATWEGGVAFRVTGILKNGAHILARNVSNKVPFGLEAYDRLNNYDIHLQGASDTFTAPQSGIFHFDFQVQWGGGPASVGLFRSSGGAVEKICSNPGNSIGYYGASTDVMLQAGDQVFVLFLHGNEENVVLGENCHFTGHFVQSNK